MNSSGDDGVIILSLGTYVKVMPQRLNDLFASVFAKLPQKVVWQLPDNSSTTLSPNIRTMGWLPQNDLLGKCLLVRTVGFVGGGGGGGAGRGRPRRRRAIISPSLIIILT